MALMNVSNTWSAIALATPALWTAIRIDFPCARGLSRLLPIWFQGARDRPLSIALDDIKYEGSELSYDLDSDVDIDFFTDTAPGPLLLLETLTICAETAENRVPFPDAQILRLLRLAPNFVQCAFQDYHF
ncbi:hypothetical protein B0H14DRAFT_3507199 [Mycena olivaceomarginata]|nr:hypothetical protein B0H14DRAFT_3507199 [Mycena olivaceomarginata]